VESAGAADRAAIEALLTVASLPTSDLARATGPEFRVVRDGGRVVGAIGLERYGDVGLLRSLVVAPDQRGRGLGTVLVDALEQEARSTGIATLVLLTQTAEVFFANRGYRRIGRADAPQAVQASAEFRSLCPVSAVAMSRVLR
jgi:amino-acid N-acetyltransferase